MAAATDTAADGFDQDFGVNAISGAGSKQGWGCCLGGVVALHSAGFTANEIIVVLSTSYPDQDCLICSPPSNWRPTRGRRPRSAGDRDREAPRPAGAAG